MNLGEIQAHRLEAHLARLQISRDVLDAQFRHFEKGAAAEVIGVVELQPFDVHHRRSQADFHLRDLRIQAGVLAQVELGERLGDHVLENNRDDREHDDEQEQRDTQAEQPAEKSFHFVGGELSDVRCGKSIGNLASAQQQGSCV